ncbi:uncharacterized protein L201_000689 [Kwoniella dendrophila CBS 6074]|uniref:Ricin B lectin domain-containing protein n=1 Tax=Kwoniella dendrophila CBS 6074 TaxID=1295534 RepID=A0AAX4JK87_9TREE
MLFLISLLPLLALSTFASPIKLDKRYTAVKIQSSRNSLCLSPEGDAIGNGVRVGTVSCDKAKTWQINEGSGSIILTGSNFALDAGTGNDNNEIVKLWQSYPGLYQQTWYLTDDNRIAITNGHQCLDQGNDQEGTQTYACNTGNVNQEWHVLEGDTGNPPSAHKYGRGTIQAKKYEGFCVTVQNGYEGHGASVDLSNCFEDDWQFTHLQRWQLRNQNTNIDKLQLISHPELCLYAGENPANGSRLNVNSCDSDNTQQWQITNDGRYKLFRTNLCLDVRAESEMRPQKPYAMYKELQVWECGEGNENQVFSTSK